MLDHKRLCNRLLEAFTGHSRDIAFICMDPGGAIVGWSGAATKLFGYAEGEALGRPLSALFVDADLAQGLDRLELEAAARDGRSESDRWHLRKDGSRVWIAGVVEAMRDGAGELMGFVKMCRDRTDLRIQIGHKEEAAAHTADVSRMLGHELRDALIPLSSAAVLIRRIGPNARAERALEILDSQAGELSRIAGDLVNSNQAGGGAPASQLQPEDLRETIEETALSFEQAAQDKGLRLVVILPAGPLWAALHRRSIQQLLAKLLDNAVARTPAGGGVFVKATQEGDEVVVRVEDTGAGIEPAVLARIFDLFTRAEPPARTDRSGLATVKRLVDLHRGTAQARSDGMGHGAEFTVRLPALPPAF